MKISIDIECSAQEMREVMGLPDVRPLQEEWLKRIEENMRVDPGSFASEDIMKSWTAGATANMNVMSRLAEAFFAAGMKNDK